MSTAGKNPDGQDDVDAIFDDMVAGLRAEGVGNRTETPETPDPPASPEPPTPAAETRKGWRSGEVGWDETMLSDGAAASDAEQDEEGHFVPPEPPPLPRPTRAMVVVALFFAVGLALLIMPSVIGMSSVVGTPLGILSLAVGLGLLLLRTRDDNRPPGADPVDGSQV